MSKFLQRLYKEVLDKFPFSISGYSNPEKEYEKFFHRICEFQESFESDNKIHFTISGFAQLEAVTNLSEANLDEWKTKSLKSFLFNDNYLGYAEPVLSLYVALLETLTPEQRIVNILAKNINNNILIKVQLNDKIEEIKLNFIKSDKTLMIEVPFLYFTDSKIDGKDCFKKLFAEIDFKKNLVVKREGSLSSYTIDLPTDETEKNTKISNLKLILQQLLNYEKVEKIANAKIDGVYDELLKSVFINNKYEAKEIYSFIFASALLCYFYDCSLTYFVSTARVTKDKRYNLGAMGIGLKNGHDLTDNDKALYSILVNHLAANLSTQLIYESNKHLKREANKLQLKSGLKSIRELQLRAENESKQSFSDILHGSIPVSEEFDNLINQVINENEILLTDEFSKYYNALKRNNDNHVSKYCLVTLIDNCKECKIQDRCHSILKVEDSSCCKSSKQIDLINLPLLDSVVKRLKSTQDTLTCNFTEGEIVFSIIKNSEPYFDVAKLQDKLSGKADYGDFLNYLSKKFEAIDCHGILTIGVSNDGCQFEETFHSRNTIQDIQHSKFILNQNYKFPKAIKYKNIKITFKNEL